MLYSIFMVIKYIIKVTIYHSTLIDYIFMVVEYISDVIFGLGIEEETPQWC